MTLQRAYQIVRSPGSHTRAELLRAHATVLSMPAGVGQHALLNLISDAVATLCAVAADKEER